MGEHVTGGEDLSPDLIRQVEGQIGLEETGVRLTALPPDIMGPDETLATASAQLINDHLETSAETLLLAQVLEIPTPEHLNLYMLRFLCVLMPFKGRNK